MTHRQRETLLIVMATIMARLGFYLFTGHTADDAFITFRYAENLADGLGFAYNAGDRAMGTSTPLFTLILAVLRIPGFPLPPTALVISLAASAATAVFLHRYAIQLRLRQLSFLPVLCYILWPRSLAGETAGMETALFTLLVTAAFYFSHRHLHYYAIGMATLATLTRPEGLGALILVFAVTAYRDRDRWWHYLIFIASLLGPWLLFAAYYFGSPIPNSIPAKVALYSQFGAATVWESIRFMLALHSPFGWALTLAALIGGWCLWRKQRAGLVEALWLVGMVALFAAGRTRLFFWYPVPLYPLLLLFACAALMAIWDRLPTVRQHDIRLPLLTSVVLMAALTVGTLKPLEYYKKTQEQLITAHRSAGYYLYAEVEPEEIVAAEDIGYLGYYSEARIIDRDGLVSPEIIPYNRSGNYLGPITAFKPDWVVLRENSPISPFVLDSSFTSAYKLTKTFPHPDGDCQIFQRR